MSKKWVVLATISLFMGLAPAFAADRIELEAQATRHILIAQSQSSIHPGPLLQERIALWRKIEQAKSLGVGVSTYESAFRAIDNDVANVSEDRTKTRVQAISTVLDKQIINAAALKQRPGSAAATSAIPTSKPTHFASSPGLTPATRASLQEYDKASADFAKQAEKFKQLTKGASPH